MITKTAETKVQDICDTLITWGFRCREKAEFLVKKTDSPEYAICAAAIKRALSGSIRTSRLSFTNGVWI
jgi:hypothetical protein